MADARDRSPSAILPPPLACPKGMSPVGPADPDGFAGDRVTAGTRWGPAIFRAGGSDSCGTAEGTPDADPVVARVQIDTETIAGDRIRALTNSGIKRSCICNARVTWSGLRR